MKRDGVATIVTDTGSVLDRGLMLGVGWVLRCAYAETSSDDIQWDPTLTSWTCQIETSPRSWSRRYLPHPLPRFKRLKLRLDRPPDSTQNPSKSARPT
jgi:hypothetical protein